MGWDGGSAMRDSSRNVPWIEIKQANLDEGTDETNDKPQLFDEDINSMKQ
jgi:hypothetical protein